MAAWAGLESRAMAKAEKPSYQGSQRRTPLQTRILLDRLVACALGGCGSG